MIRYILLLFALSLFISCGTDKTKAAAGDTLKDPAIDTMIRTENVAIEPGSIQEQAAPRSVDSGTNDKHTILANIDQYLISKPSISNATLTVENTLEDATIIKAYAQVTIVDTNDKGLRTAYLIFENIQPGDSKVVRLPDAPGGAKVISHIVRLKSDELTNGETILVGSRYIPK